MNFRDDFGKTQKRTQTRECHSFFFSIGNPHARIFSHISSEKASQLQRERQKNGKEKKYEHFSQSGYPVFQRQKSQEITEIRKTIPNLSQEIRTVVHRKRGRTGDMQREHGCVIFFFKNIKKILRPAGAWNDGQMFPVTESLASRRIFFCVA